MILRFPNSAARAAFLKRIEGDAPAMKNRFKPSFSQPTVVIVRGRGREAEEQLKSELSRYLGEGVEIFDDIQFAVMA